MRESRKEIKQVEDLMKKYRVAVKKPNSRRDYLLSIAPKVLIDTDMPDMSTEVDEEGDLNKLQDMNLSELSRAVNTPLPPRERTPHFIDSNESYNEELFAEGSEFIDQYFGRVLTQEDVDDIKNEWKKPVVVDLNTEDSDPW
jgi:hypothetical protein